MHYTGSLKSTGEKFDSSLDRGQVFEFFLGSGQVIKGWDQGLLGSSKSWVSFGMSHKSDSGLD